MTRAVVCSMKSNLCRAALAALPRSLSSADIYSKGCGDEARAEGGEVLSGEKKSCMMDLLVGESLDLHRVMV